MKRKASLIVLVILIILVLPLIVKDRSNPLKNFEGPSLSSLNYTEVDFINNFDQTKLAGMLFIPEQTKNYPLAIIINGSGYSKRKNTWYLSIVKHLQDNGIAVLFPDKRGSEKSEGNWIGASPELLSTDTESAIKFIKSQDSLNYTDIGLLGISQGGWIAPISASKTEDLSFIVNISGTITNGDEQLLHEETNTIAKYTYKPIAKLIASLTTKNLKKKESIKVFTDFDPLPYWKKTETPTFFTYGENDPNVPVNNSLKLIKDNHFSHFKTEIYPKGQHAILDISGTKINQTFLNDITNFIKENSKT